MNTQEQISKPLEIPSIEKLFNITLLSTSIAFLFRGFVQFIMNANSISVIVDFLIALLLLFFLYLSKHKGMFEVLTWPLIFTTQFAASFLWFSLGGIDSPMGLIFLATIVGYIVIDQKSQHWEMAGVVLLFSLTTLGLEYFNPDWVTPYASELARFMDYGVLLICGISLTTFTLKYKNQQFWEEKALTALRTEELKIAKERAEKFSQEKSQFLTNISHELRTPLSLIMGPIAVLLRKPEGTLEEKDVRASLEMMQKNSQNILDFMDDILDMSKLSFEQIKVEQTVVNPYAFVEGIYKKFSRQYAHRNINFRLEYWGNKNLSITFDRLKVEKILENLLSNAFKYTQEEGDVIFSVQEMENKICFEVKDTGIGIHDKDLPHIFERFYQTSENKEAIFSGIGVGLALSQELAALLGVKIEVHSTKGQGSSFFFSLPKLDSTIKAFSKAQFSKVVLVETIKEFKTKELQGIDLISINNDKKSVLFVDDSLVMRTFVQKILAPTYNVILADNGRKGLDILKKEHELIDLVITDLMMPEMDGFELLHNIKSKTWGIDLPVIVLTAKKDEPQKSKILRIGIDEYLRKPFDVDELLFSIKRLLHNSHRRNNK